MCQHLPQRVSAIFKLILLTFLYTYLNFSASAQCNCTGNLVQNPSFESGSANWSSSGGTLTIGTGAVACGSSSGDFSITNGSSNWVSQTIASGTIAVGSTIHVNVYAGTHDNSFYHQVSVQYFNSSWGWISQTAVEVNKVLATAPAGPQLYAITSVVPANTYYVQVSFNGNGNWIKTDGWCATVTPPSNCINPTQLVSNGSFNTASITGFNTDVPSGSRGFTTNPYNQINIWPSMGDHTSSTGNMMWFSDDNSGSNVKSWYQSYNVTAGKTYTFTAWARNLLTGSSQKPTLKLTVAGTQIGTAQTLEYGTGWIQLTGTYTAPSTASRQFAIVLNTNNVYYDYVLDDISITQCDAAACNPDDATASLGFCAPAPTCASGNFLWQQSINSSDGAASTVRLVSGSTNTYTLSTGFPSAFSGAVSIAVDEVISYDGYSTRNTVTQNNERWRLVFKKSGNVIYSTPYTTDVPDLKKQAYWKGSLGVQFNAPNGIDQIVIEHYDVANGYTGPGSVVPVSICLSYSTCNNITNGGSIASDEFGCSSPFDPALITSVSSPSGGSGTIEYQWLISTNAGVSSTVISGAASSTYDPGPITQTTWFRRVSRRSGCTSWNGESNWVKKEIRNSSTGSSSVTACNAYTWEGTTYTSSASPTHTYTNAAGCDSVHTLNITINYSNTGSSSVTTCNAYTWEGVTYTSSASPTHTYTNAAGCDSVHTLNITIKYSNAGSSSVTACNSYTWEGTTYTSSATPTHTYTNAAGCDSVHTLNITIKYSNTGSSSVTACNAYTWEGTTYTSSASPTHTYTNAAGCDSAHTLNITINYSNTGSSSVTACNSYTWEGTTYTSSASPTHTYMNAAGCDSVHTLNITINYSNTGSSSVTACNSYTWEGTTYTSSASPTHTYTNAAGCDSVHTLNITINYSNTGSSSVTACNAYTWEGVTYTSSASPTHTYTNAAGCDSVHTLNITINYSNTGSSSVTACNSYTWEGITYTSSASPTHTYTNAAGCDSVHTLNITINYSNTGSSSVTACNSYTWEGTTYTSSASPTHTYTNAAGCDSVHTLNITIKYSNTGSSSVTACNAYTWEGTTYTSSASPTHTYTNAAGCDSVHTLNITINYSNSGSSSVTACNSYAWEGTTYTSSASPTHTYANAAGCDSVHTLNITINYSNTGSSSVTACNSYTWEGTTYTSSASPTHTYTNAAGCDSVHTLNITINYSNTGSSSVTACNSYTWEGTTYTSSASPTHTYTNAAGCDSVHTLNITINYSNTGSSSVTACDETLLPWGQIATSSGIYSHSYTNASGCDSIHAVQVTINNSNSGSSTAVACDGYQWGMNTYTNSGSFTDVFTNAVGCDSIHTLNLTINQSNFGSSNAIACDNYTWNGATYFGSGSYNGLFQNAAGCDSIHTLNLTINNSNTGNSQVTACESYTLPWGLTITQSGNYSNTYMNDAGCDSIHTVAVTINYASSNKETISACVTYTWPLNGQTYNSSGVYTSIGTNAFGCTQYDTLVLTINPLPIVTAPDVNGCPGFAVELGGTPAGGSWNLPNPYTGSALTYTYTYTDMNGCTNSATGVFVNPPTVVITQTVNITGVSASVLYRPVPGAAWYELRWRPVGSSTWQVGTNSDKTTKVLVNLQPNTQYEVQCRVYCSITSTPPWPPTSFFFTTNNICAAPVGLFASNITATTVRLNWTPSPGAASYSVRYRKVGTTAWTTGSSTPAFKNIVGLQPNSNYEFEVRTDCSVGSSVYSAAQTFTTLTSRGMETANENTASQELQVYPNPMQELVNIEFTVPDFASTTIKFVDMSGRIVKQVLYQAEVGTNVITIPTHDLSSGMYTVHVTAEHQVIGVQRITKN